LHLYQRMMIILTAVYYNYTNVIYNTFFVHLPHFHCNLTTAISLQRRTFLKLN